MDSAMISDDAPDLRNGKIIQCRVLARTLWAGSLAGPWREAPCHYAAGLHHPHQSNFRRLSVQPTRGLDKSSYSLRRSPFFFRRVFDLLSRLEALIVFFDATILRHFTIPRHYPRLCRASRELCESS